MRFRFCGDGDCPDWVLAEINSISRLSSIKLKLVSLAIADSWDNNNELNVDKITKLLSDAKLDSSDELKACVACINFILTSATRHNCDELALASELQQLGLPQEHSQAIKRVYSEKHTRLASKLKSESLRVNKLEEIKKNPSNTSSDCVVFDFVINGETKTIKILNPDLQSLISELKFARSEITDRLQLN